MDENRANITADDLHPTYQMLVRVIGLDATLKLRQEFGGSTIHFPRLDFLTASQRQERDKRIIADYESGLYTKEQLGRKYKMVAMGITGVLKRAKTSEGSAPDGAALIEQIKQGIGELDEKGRRNVLKYVLKKKNSSRS